jgi:hypothetical protein
MNNVYHECISMMCITVATARRFTTSMIDSTRITGFILHVFGSSAYLLSPHLSPLVPRLAAVESTTNYHRLLNSASPLLVHIFLSKYFCTVTLLLAPCLLSPLLIFHSHIIPRRNYHNPIYHNPCIRFSARKLLT